MLPKDKTPCDKGWNRFIVGKIEKFFDPNNSENKCCYQEDKNGPKFYKKQPYFRHMNKVVELGKNLVSLLISTLNPSFLSVFDKLLESQ